MASRNLPPSFFNAHYHAQAKAAGPGHYSGPASDLYSSEAYSGLHHLAAHHHAASGSPDPWQYAAQVNTNINGLISPGLLITAPCLSCSACRLR